MGLFRHRGALYDDGLLCFFALYLPSCYNFSFVPVTTYLNFIANTERASMHVSAFSKILWGAVDLHMVFFSSHIHLESPRVFRSDYTPSSLLIWLHWYIFFLPSLNLLSSGLVIPLLLLLSILFLSRRLLCAAILPYYHHHCHCLQQPTLGYDSSS